MDDRFLKAGQDVQPVRVFASLGFIFWQQTPFANHSKHRGLHPAETEIEGAVADFRYRKGKRVPVSKFRETIDDGASGILEAEQPSHFVVRLSGSVVPGSSN